MHTPGRLPTHPQWVVATRTTVVMVMVVVVIMMII